MTIVNPMRMRFICSLHRTIVMKPPPGQLLKLLRRISSMHFDVRQFAEIPGAARGRSGRVPDGDVAGR
jgi:hypothetical protein